MNASKAVFQISNESVKITFNNLSIFLFLSRRQKMKVRTDIRAGAGAEDEEEPVQM